MISKNNFEGPERLSHNLNPQSVAAYSSSSCSAIRFEFEFTDWRVFVCFLGNETRPPQNISVRCVCSSHAWNYVCVCGWTNDCWPIPKAIPLEINIWFAGSDFCSKCYIFRLTTEYHFQWFRFCHRFNASNLIPQPPATSASRPRLFFYPFSHPTTVSKLTWSFLLLSFFFLLLLLLS